MKWQKVKLMSLQHRVNCYFISFHWSDLQSRTLDMFDIVSIFCRCEITVLDHSQSGFVSSYIILETCIANSTAPWIFTHGTRLKFLYIIQATVCWEFFSRVLLLHYKSPVLQLSIKRWKCLTKKKKKQLTRSENSGKCHHLRKMSLSLGQKSFFK